MAKHVAHKSIGVAAVTGTHGGGIAGNYVQILLEEIQGSVKNVNFKMFFLESGFIGQQLVDELEMSELHDLCYVGQLELYVDLVYFRLRILYLLLVFALSHLQGPAAQ